MSQGRHECWLRPSGNTLMQQVKAARSRHLRRTTERVVFVFINSFQKTSSTSSQFLASPLGKPLSLPQIFSLRFRLPMSEKYNISLWSNSRDVTSYTTFL